MSGVPALAARPADPLPETRLRASAVLTWPRLRPSAAEVAVSVWENSHVYDGLASGSIYFLSRDPAVSITREPYAYVDGDPLNSSDPSGRDPWASDPVPPVNPYVEDYLATVSEVQWRIETMYSYNDGDPGHLKQISDLLNRLPKLERWAEQASQDIPDWLKTYPQSLQAQFEQLKQHFEGSSSPSPSPSSGPCEPGGGGTVLSACNVPLPDPGEPVPFPDPVPIPIPVPAGYFGVDQCGGQWL